MKRKKRIQKKEKKRYQCWSITIETKRLEKKKNQKWQTKIFYYTTIWYHYQIYISETWIQTMQLNNNPIKNIEKIIKQTYSFPIKIIILFLNNKIFQVILPQVSSKLTFITINFVCCWLCQHVGKALICLYFHPGSILCVLVD